MVGASPRTSSFTMSSASGVRSDGIFSEEWTIGSGATPSSSPAVSGSSSTSFVVTWSEVPEHSEKE